MNGPKRPNQNLVGLYRAKKRPTYRLIKEPKSLKRPKKIEKRKRKLGERNGNNKKGSTLASRTNTTSTAGKKKNS